MEICFDRNWHDNLRKLQPNALKQVIDTIYKYMKSPDHPSLNLEKLKARGGKKRLWSIRASQDLRILLARQGDITVFLRAGKHDPIYKLGEQSAFVVPAAGSPGLMRIVRKTPLNEEDSAPPPSALPKAPPSDDGPSKSIVGHWTDKELKQAGFTESEIQKLRRASQDTLLDVWSDISSKQLDDVLKMDECLPKEWFDRDLLKDEEAKNTRFREAIIKRGALAGLSTLLSAEELERLMSAPIEEWMIFLHPDQSALVERHFNGPARVRGAAGTGKTVVALHRASALAKRYGVATPGRRPPVLFTTFIKSLPPVLKNLYLRMPQGVAGGVEFVNVDRLAYQLCREAGQKIRVDPDAAKEAFDQAFNSVIRPGTPLQGQTPRYLQEEITEVLKARGVASLEEYLRMERTGRKAPFRKEMREQVWELYEEYNKLLAETGVEDFADVRIRARDIARRQKPMYRASVIDEAQDLSLVALQLVVALVSGNKGNLGPDSLFLVGDGAQKIYPGGFTLVQAGLDVRGNSTVLRVNHRNTQEILTAAMASAGSEQVDDLGDTFLRGDAEADAQRGEGLKPQLVCAGECDAQIRYIAARVQEFLRTETLNMNPSDIAVFAANNKLVNQTIVGYPGKAFSPSPWKSTLAAATNASKSAHSTAPRDWNSRWFFFSTFLPTHSPSHAILSRKLMRRCTKSGEPWR